MASEAARIAHWDYKVGQWEHCSKAKPNATHQAILQLEKAGRLIAVITQNVDGLHALAGTSPERLVELHGTNALVECQNCGKRSEPAPHFEYFRRRRRSPVCVCGGYLKLATISFGQALNPQELERAEQAAEATDLVISLGSTLSVHPAASFPLRAAQRRVPYVIINQGPTEHDQLSCVSLRLEGDVGSIFPAAVEAALAGAKSKRQENEV
jgi:NAD-dependent deacetylase